MASSGSGITTGSGAKGPSGSAAPMGGSRPGIKMGASQNPASCNKGGGKKGK